MTKTATQQGRRAKPVNPERNLFSESRLWLEPAFSKKDV